jgi:malate dehydrogenase (oxaloacetate-decarboxylating)
MDWTDGRAVVSTGSPFEPVDVGGVRVRINQTNNSYIFPGLALGIMAVRARRVTDAMIMAAARELTEHVPTQTDPNASLLPALAEARPLSRHIARAVARAAIRDGQAEIADEAALERALDDEIWAPRYEPYERVR